MNLTEIAERITAHLRRFEANPARNPHGMSSRLLKYQNPSAWRAGNRLGIWCGARDGEATLSKADAAAYLAWLDSGNVGTHWDFARAKKEEEDAA